MSLLWPKTNIALVEHINLLATSFSFATFFLAIFSLNILANILA